MGGSRGGEREREMEMHDTSLDHSNWPPGCECGRVTALALLGVAVTSPELHNSHLVHGRHNYNVTSTFPQVLYSDIFHVLILKKNIETFLIDT